MLFHQALDLLRQRGFPAADRAQQVEDLFAFLQPLGGMAEEADDVLDTLLHAVEVTEGFVALDHLVGENPAQARILGRIHYHRFTDRHQQTLRGGGIDRGVLPAKVEVLLQGVFLLLGGHIAGLIVCENGHRSSPVNQIKTRFSPKSRRSLGVSLDRSTISTFPERVCHAKFVPGHYYFMYFCRWGTETGLELRMPGQMGTVPFRTVPIWARLVHRTG